MDPSSRQLRLDLHTAVSVSLQTRRPILHHLNADTSWLLQLPRPWSSVHHHHSNNNRRWFNILIDPWLAGSQSDVAGWFSKQWHVVDGKVASIKEVERLIQRVEALTAGGPFYQDATTNGAPNDKEEEETDDVEETSLIDCLAISHEFTDHCHRETLLTLARNVPVLATSKAASLIKSWHHFRTVVETPPFSASTDWRDVSLSPLPEWVGIARMTSQNDTLNYHSALMIVFRIEPRHTTTTTTAAPTIPFADAEAMIYTPHGIAPGSLPPLPKCHPPITTLAFLHGLHSIALTGQQLNLGAHNGLEAQRLLRAKYWIPTHDEVKRGGGVVSWFLQRRVVSVKEALQLEEERAMEVSDRVGGSGGKKMGTDMVDGVLDDVRFMDVSNGESVILV